MVKISINIYIKQHIYYGLFSTTSLQKKKKIITKLSIYKIIINSSLRFITKSTNKILKSKDN